MPSPTTLLLLAALLWVTVSDLLHRRIDNGLVLGLLMLWPAQIAVQALFADEPLAVLVQAAWALPGAVAVLVVGFGLFQLGRVGAGDVKLTAVLCLWIGASEQLTFLIITSMAGGLLALLMPVLRICEHGISLGWWAVAQRLPGQYSIPQCLGDAPLPGIPYALAIAVGAGSILLLPL